jgi:3-oxoacyl-[acyl-carrier protein] reductase
MVEEFLAAGARVAAVDLDAAAAQATADSQENPDLVRGFQADISDPASCERCAEQVLEWSGRVDVLCNNAGIFDGYESAHELPVEVWQRVIAVNLGGPFMMARAFIPAMLEQGKGVILNTASNMAFSGGGGGCAYVASKHGVIGLTRQLTFEYGRRGIRVNAICPGATATGMTLPGEVPEGFPDIAAEVERTSAGRFADPHEIAQMAVYLASDRASFVHGSSILIDGGWLTASRNAI